MIVYQGNCIIHKAGLDANGLVTIQLSSGPGAQPQFATLWFSAKPNLQKEYLSVALAALNGNKMVFARMDNRPQPAPPGATSWAPPPPGAATSTVPVENTMLEYFGMVKDSPP